jgi:hypothetical protein
LLFAIWNFSPKLKRFFVDQTGCLQPEAVLNVEPLAQTRLGKMWWWNATSIEYANNFVATSRRTRAGLNREPYTHSIASLKAVETLHK